MSEKHNHDGHRDRMRKKYMEYGAEIFEPHEMLEMLLYYAIPRKDTNKTAHELINTFGSVANGTINNAWALASGVTGYYPF